MHRKPRALKIYKLPLNELLIAGIDLFRDAANTLFRFSRGMNYKDLYLCVSLKPVEGWDYGSYKYAKHGIAYYQIGKSKPIGFCFDSFFTIFGTIEAPTTIYFTFLSKEEAKKSCVLIENLTY